MLGERGIVIQCNWGRGSAAISTTACLESKVKNSSLRKRSHARVQHTHLHGLQGAEQSLKLQTLESQMVQTWSQYLQFVFLKQAYENREVLTLRPDSRRERSRSISMPRRGEVLAILLVTNQRPRPCEMFHNTKIFTVRSCWHLAKTPSCRTTPCPMSRLLIQHIFSNTPYRVAVSPSSTWRHVTLWWQEPTISYDRYRKVILWS